MKKSISMIERTNCNWKYDTIPKGIVCWIIVKYSWENVKAPSVFIRYLTITTDNQTD